MCELSQWLIVKCNHRMFSIHHVVNDPRTQIYWSYLYFADTTLGVSYQTLPSVYDIRHLVVSSSAIQVDEKKKSVCNYTGHLDRQRKRALQNRLREHGPRGKTTVMLFSGNTTDAVLASP